MKSVSEVVESVVKDFIANSVLFTALDVSNKVKETCPFARHREVRDQIRNMFGSDIEPLGYSRTPITVTLADGSTTDALLYHSLSDIWNLDLKYSDQQRKASTNVAPTPVSTPVATVPVVTITASVSSPVTANPVVAKSFLDSWKELFKSAPSLFPKK